MKFLTFLRGTQPCPGVLTADGRRVVALSALGYAAPTLEQFIRFSVPGQLTDIREKLRAARGADLESVTLLGAIAEPFQEVIIMENNFVADQALLPTYYYKKATVCSADGDVIPDYGPRVTQLDYQAELCAVVAGDAYQVTAEEAGAHVFGYTVINNVIARDLVVRHRRPYLATSLDGYLPMASYIVTADEFGPRPDIRIRSYVNGQLRQDGSSGMAKFDFAYAIADLSKISVLRGGSIVSLGAPHGSGCHQTPPCFLRRGDVVRCEAEGVGSVCNRIG